MLIRKPEPSLRWALSTAVSLAVLSGTAFAQETQSAQRRVAIEEIVVTTQKREQRLSDVPISISAFDESFIEKVGGTTLEELTRFAPGVIVQEQSVNRTGFVIRGLTNDTANVFEESRVSTYFDGIDVSRQQGSIMELMDIERIEIVKGPQGSLFGRGSAIGALSIISKKAEFDTLGEASAGIGSYAYKMASGMFNTPLVSDKLALRVSARYRYREGFHENSVPGAPERLTGLNTIATRTALRWKPSDDLTVDFTYQFQRDRPAATEFKSLVTPPAGGDLDPFTFTAQDRRDAKIYRRVHHLSLQADWQASDTLSVASITGYRDVTALEKWDGDGTALPVIIGDQDTNQNQFSQEFRANAELGESITLIAGASYFREEADDLIRFGTNEQYFAGGFPFTRRVPAIPAGPILLPLTELTISDRIQIGTSESWSVYGDATWRPLERLELTFGVRATWDQKDSNQKAVVATADGRAPIVFRNGFFGNTNGAFRSAKDDFDYVQPRAVILYRLTENVNVYGGYGRGNRPGILNVVTANLTQPAAQRVEPEKVDNFEIGIKGFIYEQLRFELAAFHYAFKDFQSFDLQTQTVRNAGEAKTDGAEANLAWSPSERWDLWVNYSFLDGKYTRFTPSPTARDFTGNRFRLTAKHTISGGVSYNQPITDQLNGFATVMARFTSKYFFEDDNAVIKSQNPYAIVDARLGVASADGVWKVEAWVKNLLDRSYALDKGNTGGAFGIPTAVGGLPRHFGVDVTYRF